jgi:outer membrane lipoprotein-sorting protein
MRRTVIVTVLLTAWLLPVSPSAADDLLARTRALYASLRSYADTGTVLTDISSGGVAVVERHAFRTLYRSPRHFYLEFNKDKGAGGARFVIWSDAEAFHTWWSTTGVEEVYPPGTGATAFAIGALPTAGALTVIAPLLFAQAGLTGTLTEIGETSPAGVELVGGHQCQKVTGVAKSVYTATGHEFDIRKVTVWVDADTLLVRKVFEDSPRGTPAGSVLRSTVTFEPQANPALDDGKFRFTVPSSQP